MTAKKYQKVEIDGDPVFIRWDKVETWKEGKVINGVAIRVLYDGLSKDWNLQNNTVTKIWYNTKSAEIRYGNLWWNMFSVNTEQEALNQANKLIKKIRK